jgi:hypothetical protein
MVRVDDIQIHPRDNDLVLGTHGRSVWVLDDITPFEKMSDAVMASDITVFDLEPATHFRLYGRKGNTGHKWFSAANPPYGAVINYYLKDRAKDDVKVTITDKSGKLVRELKAPKDAGLNRVVWDLRTTPPVQPRENPQGGEGGGGGGFGFGPRGMRVAPGEYTVKVAAAGKQATQTVRVEEDPRIQINEADRGRLNEAQSKVYALQRSADGARRSLTNLKTQLTALEETMKKTPNVSAALTSAVKTVSDQVDDLQRKLVGDTGPLGGAGPPLPDEPRPLQNRLGQLANGLDSYTAAPTADEVRRIEDLSAEVRALVEQVNKLIDEAVPNLNKQMRDSGMTFVNAGQRIAPPQ